MKGILLKKILITLLTVTFVCISNVYAESNSVLPEKGPMSSVILGKIHTANATNAGLAQFVRDNTGSYSKLRFLGDRPVVDADGFARVKYFFEPVKGEQHRPEHSSDTFGVDTAFFTPGVDFESAGGTGHLYVSKGHDAGFNWYTGEKDISAPNPFRDQKAILKGLLSLFHTKGVVYTGTGESMDGKSAIFVLRETDDVYTVPVKYFRSLPEVNQPLEFIVEKLSSTPVVSWKYKGYPEEVESEVALSKND